jgi:hypothetical protein
LRIGVLKRLLLHDAFLPFFLFSDHCAILELGSLKSEKIAYPELIRPHTFWINDLLLYMLFREIITVYSKNRIKPINALCGQNADFVNVKACRPLGFKGLS